MSSHTQRLLLRVDGGSLECSSFSPRAQTREPSHNSNGAPSLVLKWELELLAQTVKHLPTMQETGVQPLGREDILEKEMATQSSILSGKSHGQRSLVGYSPLGRKESDTTE